MHLHQLRNATVILHIGSQQLLVDPMLGDVGCFMGFRLFRGERRRNPIVPLPDSAEAALRSVTGAVITHRHPDHLDTAAVGWMRERKLPVYGHPQDLGALRKAGLDAHDFTGAAPAIGLTVKAVPALHGYGLVGKIAGKGTGWYIAEADGPRGVYITGDTVLIDGVRAAIRDLKPQLVVAPAGVANFGVLSDLLFPEDELMELAHLAPGRVVFNHQEALDHCLYTRAQLREALTDRGLMGKCAIPEDGAIVAT